MKKLLIASALVAAGFSAQAEVSLSGGFVTDYVYRGGDLGDAGAYAGLEYGVELSEEFSVAAGVWAIDDGDDVSDAAGLEYDVYVSAGLAVSEDLSFSLGYTQYNYTYTNDVESEVNLGAAFGPVALDAAFGVDTDDEGAGTESDADYTYIAVSGSVGNIGLLAGSYDADARDGSTDEQVDDYIHYEASTSADLEAIGASVGLVVGFRDNGLDTAEDGEYIYLDFSKDFEF